MRPALIESFFASLFVLLTGTVSIPIVAYMSGAAVPSTAQSIKMSFLFFIGRWAIYFLNRIIFSKKPNK